MIEREAEEIAAYAKELFPKATASQLALLSEVVEPFPDTKFPKEMLKRLAAQSLQFSVPAVRDALAQELRRRGETAEQQHRSAERKRDRGTASEQDSISRLIADMSDEDLADSLEPALEYARTHGKPKLTAGACDFLRKRNPRTSATLQNIIYAWFLSRREAAA